MSKNIFYSFFKSENSTFSSKMKINYKLLVLKRLIFPDVKMLHRNKIQSKSGEL